MSMSSSNHNEVVNSDIHSTEAGRATPDVALRKPPECETCRVLRFRLRALIDNGCRRFQTVKTFDSIDDH